MTSRQISCHRAQALLPRYLDGTISLGERELLEAHWSACTTCNEERRAAQALDTRTRSALRAVVSGSGLSPQRAAEIRRTLVVGERARRRRWPRSGFSGIIATVAALLLVMSAGIGALRPAPQVPAATDWLTSYAATNPQRDLITGEQAQPISAPTTITFLDATQLPEAYAELIEQFRARNPDVTVAVLQPPSLIADHATLARSGDCFVAGANVAPSEARTPLLPITRFAQADAAIATDDFFPQLVALTSHGAELYGLPRTTRLHLTFYNTHVLARLKVPPPQRGWTTDDLAVSVRMLRTGLSAEYYPFLAYDGGDAAYLVTQRAGRVPEAVGERVDTSAIADALAWYVGMSAPMPQAAQLGLNDIASRSLRRALVAAGSPAIWTGPPVASRDVQPRLGIAPLPADPGSSTTLDATAYFISKETPSAGACWRWIRFLSLQQLPADDVPARRSQVESHAFLMRVGTRQRAAIAAALERVATVRPWSPSATAALGGAIDEVLLNGVSPRVALTTAQRNLLSE